MLGDFTQTNISINDTNSSIGGNDTGDNAIYNKISAAPLFLSIYAIIFIFAAGGNCLVIWIVATNRKMHEVTINYLLVNLALADLIQTLSSIFQVVDFVVKDLDIGKYNWNLYILKFILIIFLPFLEGIFEDTFKVNSAFLLEVINCVRHHCQRLYAQQLFIV